MEISDLCQLPSLVINCIDYGTYGLGQIWSPLLGAMGLVVGLIMIWRGYDDDGHPAAYCGWLAALPLMMFLYGVMLIYMFAGIALIVAPFILIGKGIGALRDGNYG